MELITSSFSSMELFVYPKASDLYVFILCPATLPTPLVSSSSLLLVFWFYIKNHVICKLGFTSSFAICIFFISFACLIALGKTSRTIMNNISGESGYPSLVPDLSRNASNFSPFIMMLALDFSAISLYYVEKCSFCI